MAVQRSDANATTLNGRVYIVGGFNGQQCVNSAEYYDPASREWTMTANMRSHRSGVSCGAYNGYVYAIGGFNGVTRLRSVERYCARTDTWFAVAEMRSCRSNFAVSVMDGRLFAIGGYNGITTIREVEGYDDQTNTWKEVCDLALTRSALHSCVVEELPNVRDYIFQDREQLAEERKRRLLASKPRNPQVERIRRPVMPPA